MTSIIIKVSQHGSSKEYLFNKLGPILIGSDAKSDLRLDRPDIEPKVLEVKMSAGQIFVKELCLRSELQLENAILPLREEIHYQDKQVIQLVGTGIQIQIHRQEVEGAEPPPFFADEFKFQLESLGKKIQEKEANLAGVEKSLEKKRLALVEADKIIQHKNLNKDKLNSELELLKAKNNDLQNEWHKKKELIQHEETRLSLIQEHIGQLQLEAKKLDNHITQHESVLFRLKGDIERHNLEVKDLKGHLAELETKKKSFQYKIDDLKREQSQIEAEISTESGKIQSILKESDSALHEKRKLDEQISVIKAEKVSLEQEITKIQASQDEDRRDGLKLKTQLENLENEISHQEGIRRQIQERIQFEQLQEKQLNTMNEELRLELIKIEDKLASKKNHHNQLDFQNSESTKQLSSLKFEIEQTQRRLDAIAADEKINDSKMQTLKIEVEVFQAQWIEKKKNLNLEHAETKNKLENELKILNRNLEQERSEYLNLQQSLRELELKYNDFVMVNKNLHVEKCEIEARIEALSHRKVELEKHGNRIKEENSSLNLEKSRLENEISILKIKLLDCEVLIKQKENDAFLEIESIKRQERLKLNSERDVMLAEIEAKKQKSLNDVEVHARIKEEQLHQTRIDHLKQAEHILKEAQAEAASILGQARAEENKIAAEATKRLEDATEEAIKREAHSHERLIEAQSYFQQKEAEAEQIIINAKKVSSELLIKNDQDIQSDLRTRKIKIKNFLTMKQEQGLTHIKNLEEAQANRLKKEERLAQEKIEHIKRKELKKVALFKSEELAKQKERNENLLKDAKTEKEKAHQAILQQKRQLEAELAETKKTVLEHLGQTRTRQQKALEEELTQARMQFEMTKKQRVQNAVQAVMNIWITQKGTNSENEVIKTQIENALQAVINGKNVEAQSKCEQILDFNPQKQKEVIPVLKKYSIRFGIPAAVAVTILADVGSFRTKLFVASKEIMRQKQSASDIFVKNQQEEWKEKYTFNPPTSDGYKTSYADNVLYTTGFVDVMESEAFQNDWILALHDFIVTQLELSEDIAISYISSEGSLIKEMALVKKDIHPQFKDQGIKKLHDLEKTTMSWLSEKITEPEKMQKFVEFRKKFYDTYYKEKYLPARVMASEKKLP